MQNNVLIGDTKCGRDNWFVSVKEKGLYKFTVTIRQYINRKKSLKILLYTEPA